MKRTIRVIHLAIYIVLAITTVQAQQVLPEGFFGGVSMHTGSPLGRLDSVDCAIASLKAQGVRQMRIELRGAEALSRLDTLLSLTDKHGMDVFVAVPDTLLVCPSSDTINTAVGARLNPEILRGHRVFAYTVVHTACVPSDTLIHAMARFFTATKGALHGFSMKHAQDPLFAVVARMPQVDYMALNMGFQVQQWASLDRVREAVGQVFSRLPFLVSEAVRALELTEKPLLIDYLDYPRDRAFHRPDSPANTRDNVLTCALQMREEYPDALRGLFLGTWVGDAESVRRQPTETLFSTDTTTLKILTSKSVEIVQ